jgi:hypothetical protein
MPTVLIDRDVPGGGFWIAVFVGRMHARLSLRQPFWRGRRRRFSEWVRLEGYNGYRA